MMIGFFKQGDRRHLWLLMLAGWLPLATVNAQQNDVGAQMRQDASELTPWSVNSARVRRNPVDQCGIGQPFEFIACGPNTRITLALMPGMWGSMEYATTQGGSMGQVLNALKGIGQADGATTLFDLAAEADSRDGSSITLVIPLIDYGFTGTFNNAAISMNRANQESHHGIYQAIGPADALPGPDKGFPLSGTVTIEEYSPFVLRGSFAGSMVDASEADLTTDNPVLPVRVNLSGTFNVIAPWRGDDRAVVRLAENIERSVRQDVPTVVGRFQGGAATDASTSPVLTIPDLEDTAGTDQSCDCSCNFAADAAVGCQQVCEGTYRACRGEPLAALTDEQRESAAKMAQTAEEAGVQLREDFIRLMERQYGQQANYEETLGSMLDTFDGMSSFNDKAMLYTTHGGEKLCPPPEPLQESMGMYQLMFCQ